MFKEFIEIYPIDKKVIAKRNININNIVEVREVNKDMNEIYLSDGRSFHTTTKDFVIVQYNG
jgi:hypothetical protein